MSEVLCPFYKPMTDNSGLCDKQRTPRDDGYCLCSCLAKGDISLCIENNYVSGLEGMIAKYINDKDEELSQLKEIIS